MMPPREDYSWKSRVFVSGRRPDVSHSMSGTLMPIFEGFGLFIIIIIFLRLNF